MSMTLETEKNKETKKKAHKAAKTRPEKPKPPPNQATKTGEHSQKGKQTQDPRTQVTLTGSQCTNNAQEK
jgi:hypothetical protein